MTAQSERESKESCSLAGMNAYISKPVDPENLIRILRMYQKRKRKVTKEEGDRHGIIK